MAFGLVAVSYLALTGYDGLRVAPYRRQGSLPADGARLVHELGADLVHAGLPGSSPEGRCASGSTARPASPPEKLRSLTVVAGITFGWEMGFVLAIGFVADTDLIAEINRLAGWANQGDRSRPLRGIARLFRDVGFHAQAREGGVPQFQNARPDIDAFLARRRSGVIDIGRGPPARSMLLLPKGDPIGYVAFLARSTPSRRCSEFASHAPGGSGAFSRRRCSRASADRATSCWRRC